MRIGPNCGFLYTSKKFPETRISRHSRVHDDGIHEEANQTFGLNPVPICYWRSHGNLLTAAVPKEQYLECRQHEHKYGHIFGTADRLKFGCQLPANDKTMPSSNAAQNSRPFAIGYKERFGFQISELLFPVPPLLLQNFTLQPCTLPHSKVRILNLQWRKW